MRIAKPVGRGDRSRGRWLRKDDDVAAMESEKDMSGTT